LTTLATPHLQLRLESAGVVSRTLAFTVDALLLVGALGVALALAGTVGAVLGWEPLTLVRGLAAGFAAALPSLWVALNAVLWAVFGRTPGKALFGVRVVRTDGTPVRLGRATIRSLGYLFSVILFVGFLWVLADPRRQAWHDKVAGTLVIYDRGRREPSTGVTT
jgi:uncharacterized RDD family membrane protein YckC